MCLIYWIFYKIYCNTPQMSYLGYKCEKLGFNVKTDNK